MIVQLIDQVHKQDDIDDLEAVAREGESLRAAEVEKAEAVIAAQVAEFARRAAERPAFAAAA